MRRTLLVLLSMLSASFVEAQTTFDVSVKASGIQRSPAPLRVFVGIGKIKFAFLTPDGFRVRDDQAQQRLIIEEPFQGTQIILRRAMPLAEGVTYKEAVLARYPGAKITGESSRHAAGQPARVFDVQWNREGVNYNARVAFISSLAGPLELIGLGSGDLQNNFDTVMATLVSSDEDGNLEVPVISDQT